MSDPNQLIRGLSLRVLAGMRIPIIHQIVVLAVRKAVSDGSAHVRRAAAMAIPKAFACVLFAFFYVLKGVACYLFNRDPSVCHRMNEKIWS